MSSRFTPKQQAEFIDERVEADIARTLGKREWRKPTEDEESADEYMAHCEEDRMATGFALMGIDE